MENDEKELLIRIDERTKNMDEKVELAFRSIGENSRRIGSLERWRAYIVGIGAALGLAVGMVVKWVHGK